jgi:hypothetical protein
MGFLNFGVTWNTFYTILGYNIVDLDWGNNLYPDALSHMES